MARNYEVLDTSELQRRGVAETVAGTLYMRADGSPRNEDIKTREHMGSRAVGEPVRARSWFGLIRTTTARFHQASLRQDWHSDETAYEDITVTAVFKGLGSDNFRVTYARAFGVGGSEIVTVDSNMQIVDYNRSENQDDPGMSAEERAAACTPEDGRAAQGLGTIAATIGIPRQNTTVLAAAIISV